MNEFKIIYIVALPLSNKIEDLENSIVRDDKILESKIDEYYNNELSDQEIFKKDENLIVTETGYYFALYKI